MSHGLLSRLGPFAELPEFFDLSQLLARYRAPIRVALPDKRDEHSSRQVDAATALSLHDKGMALILDNAERFLPELQPLLAELGRDLGLPRKCDPRCLVYVSPKGSGNSPHFDANANVVVQLRGKKRWRLAPNTHVLLPTDRWAMNQDDLSDELDGYATRPLPTAMPADAESFDLVPGSVLFVPRGTWHSTESDGDSLALNFTFGQPTWADALLAALRPQMLKNPAWRALATGFSGDDSQALDAMLALLRLEADQLEGAHVVDVMNGARGYLLAPDGFLNTDDGPLGGTVGHRSFTLALDERLRPALAWVAKQGQPFSQEDLAWAFPSLAPELLHMLKTLRSTGVLLLRHG